MTLPGDAEIGTLREALKQATAEHLRHHKLLPEWAQPASDSLDSLAALLQETREALELIASPRFIGGRDACKAVARAALSPGASGEAPPDRTRGQA